MGLLQKSKPKLSYVNGVSPAVIKKIAVFEFGNTVISVKPDESGRTLIVFLNKDFDKWQKDRFTSYWQVMLKIAS